MTPTPTGENFNTARFLPLINFDASTLTGSYQLVTPEGGFAQAVRIPLIYNSSTSLILFSTDGVTDRFFIPPSTTMVIDLQTNNAGWDRCPGYFMLRQHEELYARTSSNTSRLLIAGVY